MPRIKIILSLFIASLFIVVLPAWSQEESRTVNAEGVAAIQGNAMDIARDAAIEDAQKRAIEQAVGLLIDSQTQVENYQVISDKILSQTKGYIKRYTVNGERVDSGLLRVQITAEVALTKLTDDLSGIGILLGRMHKPRTMIMIAEQNIGHQSNAWWRRSAAEQSELGIVENTITDILSQKGFEFIDHAAAAKEIKITPSAKTDDLSASQAQALGNQTDAEVVIMGKALAKLYGDVGGGMQSAQADISVKAVRIDNGQVIATVNTHAAAVHITPETAGVEALKKASASAADQLLEKILAVYSREAGGTRSINISVVGLNKAQFMKFKDELKRRVRSIKDVHERSFDGITAKISVDSKSSAQILSDEILQQAFGTFTVDVIGSTANSLELKVNAK
jgi:Flagellar assembly protein T, N-terminal domain